MFFPQMYFATVFPGVIMQTTSFLKLHMPQGEWAPAIGNDLWVTTPEHLIDINAPKDVLPFINKDISRRKLAMSGSLWLAIERTARHDSPWAFGFKGYMTYLNVGYGDGFGLTFVCDKSF